MKTQLTGRTLWYDGTSEIAPSDLINFVTKYPRAKVCTSEITPEVQQYNKFVSNLDKIVTKAENIQFDYGWNIPQQYLNLDVSAYIIERFDKEIANNNWSMTSNEVSIRAKRIQLEMQRYKRKGLLDLLRVLIYVINTLEREGVVWGVGRGSSVSSYVLYLIGVHDIDSVLYDINMSDFIGE